MTDDYTLVTIEENVRFADLYAATRYGAYAYRMVFDPHSKRTTPVHAKRADELLDLPETKTLVQDAVKRAVERNQTTLQECLAQWLTIATADPDELIGLRVGCCRYCWGDAHRYQWTDREYEEAVARVDALNRKGATEDYPECAGGVGYRKDREPNPDCPECCGEGEERVVARDTSQLSPAARMLYGGVKQTRNGIEIVLYDRVKALENVTRMLGGFTDTINLNAKSPLVQMAQLVQITDPVAAGKAYEDMVKRLT